MPTSDADKLEPQAPAPADLYAGGTDAEAPLILRATEADFLPPWYPRVVRRRRWLTAQMWATGALLFVLVTLFVLRTDKVDAGEHRLSTLQHSQDQVGSDLRRLDGLLRRLEQLGQEAEALRHIGLPVEVTRALAEVERAMPLRMSLTRVAVAVETRRPSLVEVGRSRPAGRIDAAPVTRTDLAFTLAGLTPVSDDVASLYDRLATIELFMQPRVSFGRDVVINGTPMHEFELSFRMRLDLIGDGAGGAKP